MNNPWIELPSCSPFVLPHDEEAINLFNQNVSDEYRYDLDLFPEPFVGSLLAPIILLALNPGISDGDHEFQSHPTTREILRSACHQNSNIGQLYYLMSPFLLSPGGKWWSSKTRYLCNELGLELVSKSLCCIQYFPYHSKKFKGIPMATETLRFTAAQVVNAIRLRKQVIVMRSFKHWIKLVPELDGYDRLSIVKNPLNPCLSPPNLGSKYEDIVTAIASWK